MLASFYICQLAWFQVFLVLVLASSAYSGYTMPFHLYNQSGSCKLLGGLQSVGHMHPDSSCMIGACWRVVRSESLWPAISLASVREVSIPGGGEEGYFGGMGFPVVHPCNGFGVFDK